MKTYIDLVDECDSFPYFEQNPKHYAQFLSSYWEFHLPGGEGPHGLMHEDIKDRMPWDESWQFQREPNMVTIANSKEPQDHIIRDTLERARKDDRFQVLKGWRNELYPIYRPGQNVVSMERAASALFGINTYGVHLTAYVTTEDGMKIWIPRRARTKQTYGGMLDNTVAGGLSTGETPLECIVREASEEASFPEDFVRSTARPCGTVSYVHVRDKRAGGETGLIQPECQFIYDIEVGTDMVPKPGDNEVENFYLWTVEEVQKALGEGQFKPNCAVVLLDFFIRHGILTSENESKYVDIISRIHRRLPFPTC